MNPTWATDDGRIQLYHGDCIATMRQLPAESVHCCVTSPPYWGLRSYLPDAVQMKATAPDSVLRELESLGIYPIDHT